MRQDAIFDSLKQFSKGFAERVNDILLFMDSKHFILIIYYLQMNKSLFKMNAWAFLMADYGLFISTSTDLMAAFVHLIAFQANK